MLLKTNAKTLKGTITVPGDKSISHRAIIFGSMASGVTTVYGLLESQDVFNTIQTFRALGVSIIKEHDIYKITGSKTFSTPGNPLDMGNSGTSMRLISGLLASQDITVTMTGDRSLSKRPMDRISKPLSQMGATIKGIGPKVTAPITIEGNSHLQPITYHIPVASAQVKSAILLAALGTKGETVLYEKEITRNHTEEMIEQFGGHIKQVGKEIRLVGPQELVAQDILVPGDISSAAFWIVAALIVPGSEIVLENVGINQTRTGILDVVKAMGGKIDFLEINRKQHSATIKVTYSNLKGTVIEGDFIPRLIDEIPIIALLASQAEGKTIIRNAEELRVKETDRIQVVSDILLAMGANIQVQDDGMIIEGGHPLHGTHANAHMDHRIAMMVAIAALIVKKGSVSLDNWQAIETSYPTFFKDLESIYYV